MQAHAKPHMAAMVAESCWGLLYGNITAINTQSLAWQW